MDIVVLIVILAIAITIAVFAGIAIQQERTQAPTKKIEVKTIKDDRRTKMTPEEMLLDGWCDECDQDPAECINNGRCKGEVYKDDDSEQIINKLKGGKE